MTEVVLRSVSYTVYLKCLCCFDFVTTVWFLPSQNCKIICLMSFTSFYYWYCRKFYLINEHKSEKFVHSLLFCWLLIEFVFIVFTIVVYKLLMLIRLDQECVKIVVYYRKGLLHCFRLFIRTALAQLASFL